MQRYARVGVLEIEPVLELIRADSEPMELHGKRVKFGGLRLKTFAYKGTSCSSCGMEANLFAVESNSGDQFHLNMWGVDSDGRECLMTHDHTLARGLGGADELDNCTTMCYKCNQRKAKVEQRIFNIQRGPVTGTGARKRRRAVEKAERILTDPIYRAKVEYHRSLKMM